MPEVIRVLELCSVDGTGGGAEQIILRTAARVNPERMYVTVCFLHRAGDAAYDLHLRAAALGIDYCAVVERSPWDSRTLPALRAIVRGRRIAIVHAHGYKAAFLAWRLARTEGIVPISTSHGWSGRHWRERFVYYPAEKRIIRRFPLAIAVSSQIRAVLVRCGCRPERVRVLLNGIDPDEFSPDIAAAFRMRTALELAPGDVVLGAVGRLEPEKRFDVLLETMRRLSPRRPNLKLLIVGEGSLRTRLKEQIARLGLADRCCLLGHRNDVRDVYRAFDVLVQSSDREGTPTVVVEAMAMKVPVVATDVGGTGELMRHGVHGLLAPRRDPTALAAAIEETLDDIPATSRRVTAARARVEGELSFAVRTATMEDLYREAYEHHNLAYTCGTS